MANRRSAFVVFAISVIGCSNQEGPAQPTSKEAVVSAVVSKQAEAPSA
jgi:hypothetical protein